MTALLVAGAPAHADDARSLANLRAAAKCDDKSSVWRVWCIAADYANGTAGELPKGKVLVGLSIALDDKKPAADALRDSVSLSAFAIDADGKLKLTDIKPTSKAEEQAAGEAVFNLAATFKGKSAKAKLPGDVAAYVKTLKGTYEAKQQGGDWTWTGATPSTLRKVGDYWVVIEHPPHGIIATILTDRWE